MRSKVVSLLFLLLSITSLEAARAPEWAFKARQEATAFMKKGEWPSAIKVFERVDQVMEGRDFLEAQWYGWFIYHRGLSEYRAKKYEAAMKSFERYYNKFGPQK